MKDKGINIFDKLSSLDFLEKKIIKILYFSESAISIKEIRDYIILGTTFFLLRLPGAYKDPDVYVVLRKYNSGSLNIEDIKTQTKLIEKLTKDIRDIFYTEKPLYEIVSELNKYFANNKHHKISVPSFNTIENNLNNLKELNLVSFRELKNKNAKGLWFLKGEIKKSIDSKHL